MQRISRAGDTLWSVSAFDPRKPVDPDWASRPAKPILRSGDEDLVLREGPWEHHQGEDSMQWSPEGHGAVEYDLDDEPGSDFDHLPEVDSEQFVQHLPASELNDLFAHRERLKGIGGRLDGSQGHYVEYHPTSSVNHYYTYNPRMMDDAEPWNLVSHHWALRDPVQSRHQTFSEAVNRAQRNRVIIDRQVG